MHLNTTSKLHLNSGCWPLFGMLKSYSSFKLNSYEILLRDIREQADCACKWPCRQERKKKRPSFSFFHMFSMQLHLDLWVYIIFSQLVKPVVRLQPWTNCAGKCAKTQENNRSTYRISVSTPILPIVS